MTCVVTWVDVWRVIFSFATPESQCAIALSSIVCMHVLWYVCLDGIIRVGHCGQLRWFLQKWFIILSTVTLPTNQIQCFATMNLPGNNLLCFVLLILILTIVQFHINFTVVGIIFFSVIIMSELMHTLTNHMMKKFRKKRILISI